MAILHNYLIFNIIYLVVSFWICKVKLYIDWKKVIKGLVKSLSKKKILSKVNLHINVKNFMVTSIKSKRDPNHASTTYQFLNGVLTWWPTILHLLQTYIYFSMDLFLHSYTCIQKRSLKKLKHYNILFSLVLLYLPKIS
jgi:hypothetical protein